MKGLEYVWLSKRDEIIMCELFVITFLMILWTKKEGGGIEVCQRFGGLERWNEVPEVTR